MNPATGIFGLRCSLSRVLCATFWLAMMMALPCSAQVSNGGHFPSGGGQTTNQRTVYPAPPPDDMNQPLAGNPGEPVFMERRMRQLNAVQHKSMVADTEKLLQLVTELNEEINSTNSNSLTQAQLRKVMEIEKLAHSVKDKMRTSVRGVPDYQDNSPLPPVSHR
jgi:hypothetical protein